MQRISSGGPSRRKLLDAHPCTSLAEKRRGEAQANTQIKHTYNMLGYSLNFSRCSRGKEKERANQYGRG